MVSRLKMTSNEPFGNSRFVTSPTSKWTCCTHRQILYIVTQIRRKVWDEEGWALPATLTAPPSFVIYDIRALWRSGLSVRVPEECPDVKNYKWRLNPVLHRIHYCANGLIHLDQPFQTRKTQSREHIGPIRDTDLSAYQWLKWKCWGGGTVPAHLGPLSLHVGPLLTVVPPGDHWTTEYLFIY